MRIAVQPIEIAVEVCAVCRGRFIVRRDYLGSVRASLQPRPFQFKERVRERLANVEAVVLGLKESDHKAKVRIGLSFATLRYIMGLRRA